LSRIANGHPSDEVSFEWRADGVYKADIDHNVLAETSSRADAPTGWRDALLAFASNGGLRSEELGAQEGELSYLRQLEVDDRPWPVLAQLSCGAATPETLYTCAADNTIIARVRIANRANAAKAFRLALRPLGATLDTKHYLDYDTSIAANVSVVLDLFFLMMDTDVLTVYASSADLSVALFGEVGA
jgi:hypothetical protein